MARFVYALGALVCAVAIGAGGISAAADGTARVVSAPASAGMLSGTGTANESVARSDAFSLLSQLPLPAGATQSATEPIGDNALLARPGFVPPGTPNAVDEYAWWLIPGSPAGVLAYIRAHPPAGTERGFRSHLNGGPFLPGRETEALVWPITNILTTRQLIVTVVSLPSGATGLRADAQVVWVTPRPPSETIPPGAHIVRVSVRSSIRGNQPNQQPLTVTSSKKVERIVALLNALPVAQPGLRSCRVGFGIRVRLAFYATRGESPLAIAEADPLGCGEVQLTIGATPEPELEGGVWLIKQIERVLGIKLHTTPRRLHIPIKHARRLGSM